MRKIGLIIGLTALAEPALPADLATIDWSKVPVANVTLFYPGQSSYEWLRTDDHWGSRSVLDGGDCTTCHRGRKGRSGTRSSRVAGWSQRRSKARTAPSI